MLGLNRLKKIYDSCVALWVTVGRQVLTEKKNEWNKNTISVVPMH